MSSAGIEPRRTIVSDRSRKTTAAKRKHPASVPIAAVSTRPQPPPAVYALRVWSVKKVNGEWFISQAARFDNKEQWMGPYANVHRATTAIARKLAEEITERHRTRCRNYGIDD
jgi:hypothetical protein